MLSVSGLHLAAVAALLFVLVRAAAARVPRLPLYVDPRAVAAAVALPAIAFFALLTGEAVATLRSALMLSLAMAAFLVGRRASPGPTIAAAALVLLAARPLQLLRRVAAAFAGVGDRHRPVRARHRARAATAAAAARPAAALAWLWRFAAATAAATAATAPLVAHHFGEVAPLSPLGNLALVPLVELGVVPFGLAGAAAGAIWAPLGPLPLAVAGLAARAALAIAARLPRPRPRSGSAARRTCSRPPRSRRPGALALIAIGGARPADGACAAVAAWRPRCWRSPAWRRATSLAGRART